MSITILHLLGATCAGKTTLQDRIGHRFPNDAHLVSVGKMMRAKYSPDYFKGQAQPEHTKEEAWQMYNDAVNAGIKLGKKFIVVDGQPRDAMQTERVLSVWSNWPQRSSLDITLKFLLIHASHEKREERAKLGRNPGPDLDLALARLTNDYRNCYVVMTELLLKKHQIDVIDTTHWTFGDVEDAVQKIGKWYGLSH